ncbi:MAG: LPS assembly lipoprotein LptE [Microvirga sp.]|nr:LPS assembly lipoprotein LptE [Microvirga sp.]
MSWSRSLSRRTALLALTIGASIGLAGCFTPLYGPTASGVGVGESLKTIDVGEVVVGGASEEMAHALRSELIFAFDGSRDRVIEKQYRLSAVVTVGQTSPIVSTATGRALTSTVTATARWRINEIDGDRLVLEGQASASASFDRVQQRFATVRAQRDAELRAARLLSEQISTRIAIDVRTGALAR